MGKNKRQARKHSNHHDNPSKPKSTINRRQHSQLPPSKSNKVVAQRARNGPPQIRVKVPFTKSDNVLLIGEGDFSFSLSLKLHHRVNQITTTCYDSKETLESKYVDVRKTIGQLEVLNDEVRLTSLTTSPEKHSGQSCNEDISVWEGLSPSPPASRAVEGDEQQEGLSNIAKVKILYGIDATKLSSAHKKLLRPYTPFNKIVFNFPHVGGMSTDVNRQVRYNQELLVGFFKSAKELLSTPNRPAKIIASEEDEFDDYDEWSEDIQAAGAVNGQILVTIFEGEPYTLWNVRDLARHSGLKVVESFKFPWSAYPGYSHARTVGDIITGKDRSDEGKRKGAWRGEERDARCYVLEDQNAAPSSQYSSKRKKGRDSDDEDSD
ncbi:hypothetical protein EDD36DRAFT_281142 [Exophiala viscosa]|uniref:25S rRNA (uridine-N(3))-methyltransferase BMT5-like domain-containing protein n=1 Tax=Exophiala viscosa TaxID=2486360 RepID=A0AAN6ICQ9_9EURO|nr:hypothetical protein EDD36DRAFT_281142 [Exophiala viscosa]